MLDINLKGEKVFAVADELGRRGIPYVFTTGYDASAVAEKYREVPRWEKPFDPGELVERFAFLRGEQASEGA